MEEFFMNPRSGLGKSSFDCWKLIVVKFAATTPPRVKGIRNRREVSNIKSIIEANNGLFESII